MIRKAKPSKRAAEPGWLSPMRLGIAALIIIGAIILFAVWQSISAQRERARPIEGVEQFPKVEGGHQEGQLSYEQTPPVGGVHNPVWQNCGVYNEPIQTENAVHSMEHGAIWITYRPDLAADQVEALRSLTRRSNYRLLSPYPDLPSPIVASAWGYQLKLETVDDPRLQRFITKYEQNPYGPEPGAACIQGVGTPN